MSCLSAHIPGSTPVQGGCGARALGRPGQPRSTSAICEIYFRLYIFNYNNIEIYHMGAYMYILIYLYGGNQDQPVPYSMKYINV